jgi:hypothetical protein
MAWGWAGGCWNHFSCVSSIHFTNAQVPNPWLEVDKDLKKYITRVGVVPLIQNAMTNIQKTSNAQKGEYLTHLNPGRCSRRN